MNKSAAAPKKGITHFRRLCEFGGRLSGSISEHEALNYVAKYLGSLTSGSLSFHNVEYDAWSSSEIQLTINNKNHAATPLPGCGSTPDDGVDLEVVDCGRGSPAQLINLADKIKGRAVLVTHEYMFSAEHIHRSQKFETALALGAVAFVISNPWDDSGMVTGHASFEIPAFGVSKKTGDTLRAAAQSGTSIYVKLLTHHGSDRTQTLNWIIPPGTSDKGIDEKEIIVCAHIDGHAVSQSAMDNASGVAVALALAAQLEVKSPYSISTRILIFSAEEQGLLGSRQYVASLAESEKRKIKAVLNLDCVAGSSKLCAMISEFDYLREVVLESSKISGIPVAIFEPLVANSDHYNFAIVDIPALRLIADFGEHDSTLRHVLTSADKQELVNEKELDNCLKVVQSMISYMA